MKKALFAFRPLTGKEKMFFSAVKAIYYLLLLITVLLSRGHGLTAADGNGIAGHKRGFVGTKP